MARLKYFKFFIPGLRQKSTRVLLAAAIAGAISFSAQADVAPSSPHFLPSPHYFLGGDLGYGTVSPYSPVEGSRDGVQFDLKGVASYYLPWWVFDGGLGWEYSKRAGTNTDQSYTKVITKGFFLEASARYGHPWGWQIGPVLDYTLVGNIGLGPSVAADQGVSALYGGVQVFYEIPEPDHRVRIGAKIATSLNVNGRTENIYQASLEFGWPFERREPAQRSRPIAREGFDILQKDRDTQKVKVVLDARRIEFDVNKATLRPAAKKRLGRLGKFLAAHPDAWTKLIISGHTDEHGSIEYNQRLSENRARAVRTALIDRGVPVDKLESRGFSKLQPIDLGHNERAWQRNRRVEFEFSGVDDQDMLIQGVDQATTNESGDEAPSP